MTKDQEEAIIFNSDGTIQGKHQFSRKPKAAAAPLVDEGVQSVNPIKPDMNPALLKRINAEAAKSVEGPADELADTIYNKFMTLLSDHIAAKGGSLTMDDVAKMGEEFRSDMDVIKQTFLNSVETYSLARERSQITRSRGQIFNRIIIQRFEHRLTDEDALKNKPDHLSRRILPGFHSTLSMMFGPPKLERYEQQARHILDRLREENGGQIEWSALYQAPESQRIALRAEIDIAKHFKDTEKRLDWMVAMINSNLIPADDHTVSAGWAFTREMAEAILSDLFQDLRKTITSSTAKKKFIEELGEETVGVLENVVHRFS
ncbi:MAG: hypothetical protein HQ501_08595 [Rhodospirillales bacterium]|nr:hypothetical protein [Rhodospirillales bacterium]